MPKFLNSVYRDAAPLASKFQGNDPFDHMVFDSFLEDGLAECLAEQFPTPDRGNWWQYDNPLEKKLAFNNLSQLPDVFSEFFALVNSSAFVAWLSVLSGLKLHADPALLGGGLHLIKQGGKLDVHEDFNIHRDMNMLRSLNLIVYLNRDWGKGWGGDLELWNPDMTVQAHKIEPLFNRAVIFRTDQHSNHGHPHPLACPPDRYRMSLASY